jgi:hypothetical protein
MGLVLIAPASAATITVGYAGDPATGNPANCNTATTCTLRDAIAKAANGDSIVFNLPVSSIIVNSVLSTLGKNLTIDGSAVSNLTISASGASRVFSISSNTVTLKSLTITRSNGTANGGISIGSLGVLTLDNVTVSGNATTGDGGGINNNGTLKLINSTVSGNTASGDGTATGLGGGIFNTGTVTITGSSTIANNSAAAGGGIYSIDSSTNPNITIDHSFVTGNKATVNGGGGIFNSVSTASSNAMLTITNSSVSGNTTSTSTGDGGGIYNAAILTMDNLTLSNNTAFNYGGGIYNTGKIGIGAGSVATIDHSSITGNHAALGGGILNNVGSYMGRLTLNNSTLSGNPASSKAGGAYNYYSYLTLTNSTVTGNSVGSSGLGGGILSGYSGVLTLTNSTLARNKAGTADSDVYNVYNPNSTSVVNTIIQSCQVDGTNTTALTDVGGNLDGGTGCGFPTVNNSKSNALIALDILANNGGPTQTMMPLSSSDAIGRGLPSVCNIAPVKHKDQRGYIRSATVCTSGAVDPNGINDTIFADGFGFGE